jgi:hypothetical protein
MWHYTRSAIGWTWIVGTVLAYLVTRPLVALGNDTFWADVIAMAIALGIWAASHLSTREDVVYQRQYHRIGVIAANVLIAICLIPIAILLLLLSGAGTRSVSLSPGEILRIDLTD